jgi:hypothetical protein
MFFILRASATFFPSKSSATAAGLARATAANTATSHDRRSLKMFRTVDFPFRRQPLTADVTPASFANYIPRIGQRKWVAGLSAPGRLT